jgi:hypothetical protein
MLACGDGSTSTTQDPMSRGAAAYPIAYVYSAEEYEADVRLAGVSVSSK